MQSASAGPAAAVPLVRGAARLGQAGGIGGKVQAVRKLAARHLDAKQGDLGRGLSARWEALDVTSLANHGLLRGRPRGLEMFSSATMPSAIGDGWRLLRSHR